MYCLDFPALNRGLHHSVRTVEVNFANPSSNLGFNYSTGSHIHKLSLVDTGIDGVKCVSAHGHYGKGPWCAACKLSGTGSAQTNTSPSAPGDEAQPVVTVMFAEDE